MTHWNYRTTRIDGGPVAIREVYYDGEEVVGYVAEPVALGYFESAEEACRSVALIRKAFEKPVLDLE
jgi:hypothetical protein